MDISDLVGLFDPILLTSVRKELDRLASTKDKRGKFAALALELMAEGRFRMETERRFRIETDGWEAQRRDSLLRPGNGSRGRHRREELVERLRASKVSSVLTPRSGRFSL